MQAKATLRDDGMAETTGLAASVPWWSFTKTVLATALIRLSEAGRIELDTAVDGQPYTPAQLLRHEAGLPDYGSVPAYHAAVAARGAPWPVDEMLDAAAADHLRYRPGEDWAYSNIGYWKVARLIEAASDRPLADALAGLVFRPAGLSTARLAVVPADLVSVEMGDVTGYHPGWVYHGLVVGTVLDAARLLRRLLGGGLVGADSLARMLEGRELPQFRSERHPDPAYGLGLMLTASSPIDHPVGHGGSGPGSRIAVYARRGTACSVWADTRSGIDPEAEVLGIVGRGPH